MSKPALHSAMIADAMEDVLVVDDEVDIGRLLALHLKKAGLGVDVAHSGTEALLAVRRKRPSLIILDLMLPDVPGTEVCRRLRADSELSEIGVLMLTARGDDEDRIIGFELGADDYVVKPFNVHEVVLRAQALLRRIGERVAARAHAGHPVMLRWRTLEVDPVRHRVSAEGREMSLRPIEFKLLSLFLEHPSRVFSRAQLLDAVWGTQSTVNERTVDVHIRRLREQLGSNGAAVETVQGFGYRLRDP